MEHDSTLTTLFSSWAETLGEGKIVIVYEFCIITIIIIIVDFAICGHTGKREKRASGDAEAYQDS